MHSAPFWYDGCMDLIMLSKIRNAVGRWGWLDAWMAHGASKGPLWLFVLMGVLLLQGREGLAVDALAVLAATVTRGVNEGIGRLYHRDRPFVRERFVPLIEHEPSFSFPSNHSACGFALAVVVCFAHPLVGGLMLLLSSWMAYGRLYVGVHYPFDVIAGAGIGVLVAWSVHLAL